jgi:hypothetical protein
MKRPQLTKEERIILSPGGFSRRDGFRINNPRTRRAFDAWLEATKELRS